MDADNHQETLENLRKAMRNSWKLCAVSSLLARSYLAALFDDYLGLSRCLSTGFLQIMMDTTSPELRVCNKSGKTVELKADDFVTVTSDTSKELSSEILPVDNNI